MDGSPLIVQPGEHLLKRNGIDSWNLKFNAWETVATAILSEIMLVDQPRGLELEYRIIAVNKASDGPPSNTVMAVL